MPRLHLTARPESVGGTHADRMIHRESNQMIIGPYFIDAQGRVRVVSPKVMPGRITAVARHLTDPANKVYFATMEQGFYEVDVHSLEVKVLNKDRNVGGKAVVPGRHGKGCYTGQGRLVFANNGEGGVLAEWDGSKPLAAPGAWTIVDRNKYTDITGPGGVYGSPDDDAPLWAIGWDARSVLLNVPRRRAVDPLPPAQGKLYPGRRPRLVYRVAADPRGRRRTFPLEHARHVLRFPQDLPPGPHGGHPADLDVPENGGGLRRLERPAGDGP